MEVLKDASREDVLKKKRELLSELRRSHVYILEKGAIEAYYPHTVTGADKPTKAQCFCSAVTTPEGVRELCDKIDVDGRSVSEFDAIFRGIFEG